MGECFAAVDEVVEASSFRVDLPKPRIGSAAKKRCQQIAINDRECLIPQGLFELLAPTAELGYGLDDRQDLSFDRWHNGRLNTEIGPEGAENSEMPCCDDLEDNGTVEEDDLSLRLQQIRTSRSAHAATGSIRSPNLSAKVYRSIISSSAAFPMLISPTFKVSMTCLT